jgi:hypothetical protein
MDDTGGSNYQPMGTSQLLSVPYALHAKTAENVPAPLQIGDTHAGGIIFHLDPDGVHGLVAAASDQGTARWGCFGTELPGVQNVTNNPPTGPGADIGWGAVNTAAIVNDCADAGIAARLCDELVLNGYNDWFLPSAVELNLMYTNLHLAGLGGFASDDYWSSSENPSNSAWEQDFGNGLQGMNSKDSFQRVRAVRAF